MRADYWKDFCKDMLDSAFQHLIKTIRKLLSEE